MIRDAARGRRRMRQHRAGRQTRLVGLALVLMRVLNACDLGGPQTPTPTDSAPPPTPVGAVGPGGSAPGETPAEQPAGAAPPGAPAQADTPTAVAAGVRPTAHSGDI